MAVFVKCILSLVLALLLSGLLIGVVPAFFYPALVVTPFIVLSPWMVGNRTVTLFGLKILIGMALAVGAMFIANRMNAVMRLPLMLAGFLLPWFVIKGSKEPSTGVNQGSRVVEQSADIPTVLTEIIDLPLAGLTSSDNASSELDKFVDKFRDRLRFYESTDVVILSSEAVTKNSVEAVTATASSHDGSLRVWARVRHELSRLRVELRYAEKGSYGWKQSSRQTNWKYEDALSQYHRESDIQRSRDDSHNAGDTGLLWLPFALAGNRALQKQFGHLSREKAEEASALRTLFIRSMSEAYEEFKSQRQEDAFQNRVTPAQSTTDVRESDDISL